MNYRKHYDLLIERSKSRDLSGYTERHHIVPKCMGGTNSRSNIAILTPKEHFLAHQLLMKMYPENRDLVLAVKIMTVSSDTVIRNNKMFGWLRKRFSEAMKQRVVTEATKNKISIANIGNKNAQGLKHSDESKNKISIAGMRPCSEEKKKKIGDANRGRKSPFKGQILPVVKCPHCSKEGAGGSMKRYHFENCKELNDYRS